MSTVPVCVNAHVGEYTLVEVREQRPWAGLGSLPCFVWYRVIGQELHQGDYGCLASESLTIPWSVSTIFHCWDYRCLPYWPFTASGDPNAGLHPCKRSFSRLNHLTGPTVFTFLNLHHKHIAQLGPIHTLCAQAHYFLIVLIHFLKNIYFEDFSINSPSLNSRTASLQRDVQFI